jgi:hypothetical protein
VTSSYTGLQVPAFYATLDGATHFEPVGSGGRELAPSIAWLRLWVFNDEGAKSFFYGADCRLCKSPWTKQTNAKWKYARRVAAGRALARGRRLRTLQENLPIQRIVAESRSSFKNSAGRPANR